MLHFSHIPLPQTYMAIPHCKEGWEVSSLAESPCVQKKQGNAFGAEGTTGFSVH